MKEQFYVDLRRREEAKKRWEKLQKTLQEEPIDKSEYYCTDMNFPMRNCHPVIRRRTLAQVWDLIKFK